MYDVIIVGAGPAGATAGKYLAQAGKNVLLFQKDLDFKKPCGGGLRLDAFDEFEIDKNEIQELVTEIVIESKGIRFSYDIAATPLTIVDRVRFDQSLRAEALNAGATLLEEKVTKVTVSEEGVQVEAEGSSGRKLYEAAYVIAADGVHSQVRKKVRAETVPAHMTHYRDVDSMQTSACHFYFGTAFAKGAYGWRFPYEGGSDIGVVASNNDKKYIQILFKMLGLQQQTKIRGYKIPVWKETLFYEQRIFYVGDAAGQVLPFTYEGIYYGMKSAKLLSEVIIEEEDPALYERRWKRLYQKKFFILLRLEKLFLHSDTMIYLMMKTLEKPAVKKKVLKLWMDEYPVIFNLHFFRQIIKNIFIKNR